MTCVGTCPHLRVQDAPDLLSPGTVIVLPLTIHRRFPFWKMQEKVTESPSPLCLLAVDGRTPDVIGYTYGRAIPGFLFCIPGIKGGFCWVVQKGVESEQLSGHILLLWRGGWAGVESSFKIAAGDFDLAARAKLGRKPAKVTWRNRKPRVSRSLQDLRFKDHKLDHMNNFFLCPSWLPKKGLNHTD